MALPTKCESRSLPLHRPIWLWGSQGCNSEDCLRLKTKLNSVALVRERTIPTDRRLLAKLVPPFADRGHLQKFTRGKSSYILQSYWLAKNLGYMWRVAGRNLTQMHIDDSVILQYYFDSWIILCICDRFIKVMTKPCALVVGRHVWHSEGLRFDSSVRTPAILTEVIRGISQSLLGNRLKYSTVLFFHILSN
jgi:hypothetical protein